MPLPIDTVKEALGRTGASDLDEILASVLSKSEWKTKEDLLDAMKGARWWQYCEKDWYSTPDVRGHFTTMPIDVAMRKVSKGLLVCNQYMGLMLVVPWPNLRKATTSMYVRVSDGVLKEARFGEPIRMSVVPDTLAGAANRWAWENDMKLVDLKEAKECGIPWDVYLVDRKEFING